MDIKLFDTNEIVSFSNKVFNVNFNSYLVHQVVTSYRINSRKGNSCQKSRSDVSGSNKKPWSQKGTGRARAGSNKSPIWRSGGVAFASKPKKYFLKVNKKVYKLSLKMVLSKLFIDYNVYVLKKILIDKPKTKFFLKYFNFVNYYKCLIILNKLDNNIILSSRNLYNFKVCDIFHINIIDLISFRSIIFSLDSLKYIEKKLL